MTNNKLIALCIASSSVMAGGTAVIDGGIAGAYNDPYNNPLISMSGPGSSTFPNAFLNYILFDEEYVPVRAKSFPVQNLPSTRHTVQFDQSLEVKELGYLFVYLSYDNNNSNLYLYFDDLKVIVDESPVIQVNNYYPFGMVSNTWLREGEIDNEKLFQGKELIAQTGCLPAVASAKAGHDFGSRMYWADLGRWFSTDPQKQFSSPYVGMGNMPVIGVDPDGEFVFFLGLGLGLISGYASGDAAGLKGWDLVAHTFASGIIGGMAGGIGQAVGTALTNTSMNAVVASGIAGAAAGGVGGFYGTALNGGDPIEGMWKGAVAGLVGGSIGATAKGGFGAFLGGASGGATGSALNGGDFGDMLRGALISGGLSFGLYHGSLALKSGNKSGTEFDELSPKDRRTLSRISQRASASAKNKEFAWDKYKDGQESDIIPSQGRPGLVRKLGVYRSTTGKIKFHKMVEGTVYDDIVYSNTIKNYTRWSVHTHRGIGPTNFSEGIGYDTGTIDAYNIPHSLVMNRSFIYYRSQTGPTTLVGNTNRYVHRSVWGF